MRKVVIVFFVLLISVFTKAQNSNNYLQVFTNTGINFLIDDPAALENPQTINGAFTIRVRTKKKTCYVYARISNYNAPSGFYPASSPLALDWTGDSSPNAFNITTAPITLEAYDKLLFSQPKMSNSPSYYQFYYDLKLSGLSYDYPPGNYNFTILFTMTHP